jgi:hypothetical protein
LRFIPFCPSPSPDRQQLPRSRAIAPSSGAEFRAFRLGTLLAASSARSLSMMLDRDPPTVPTYHLFAQPNDAAKQAERSRPWAAEEFSFHDLLDTINPLQHLPIVSTIYRYLTGDTIGNVPRIAGDTLYGGPLGFISGLIGAAVKQESGRDIGEHVLAMITGDDGGKGGAPADGATALASAAGAPATATGVPAPAAVTGSGDGAATPAVAAATAPLQASASQIGGRAAAGLPLASAKPAAADSDPRAAFLAQANAVRRLPGAQSAAPLNNRPVPLQGFGLPPGFAVPKLTAASAVAADASPPLPGTTAGGPLLPNGLPSKTPLEISQQMLDALDKYAKLRQQRGSQLDVVQ